MTLNEIACAFDHPASLDEQTVKLVITAINTARWQLSYYDWIEKLEVDDDNYWREKWEQFDKLASATRHFDPATLYRMIS